MDPGISAVLAALITTAGTVLAVYLSNRKSYRRGQAAKARSTRPRPQARVM
jgi:hypothetical protein